MREPMDSLTDPRVKRIVLMTSAQVAKSTFIENALGYYAHRDPCPIMVVQPTLGLAEDFSKDRLSPMIRDTPALTNLFVEANARKSGNTILNKRFRGGFVVLAGANSPASLAGRPIRIGLGDEIDRWPDTAGPEGDPVALFSARTTAWWNSKEIYCSTPTISGRSRISALYDDSDQSKYFIPCPHCDEPFVMLFEHLKYKEGTPIPGSDGRQVRTAIDAWIECPGCSGQIRDAQRWAAVKAGQWRATAEFRGTRGFWLWAAYSPFVTALNIANKWLAAQGDQGQIKTFKNLVLGETYAETGEAPDWERLLSRREIYPSNRVPMGGLFLTAGVDVQADRIECSLYAWGRDRQRWLIEHAVLMGRTTEDKVWADLTAWKHSTWKHEGGADMSIVRLAIDTGHETNRVYQWVRTQGSETLAVDGRSSLFGSIVGQPTSVDVDISGRKVRRGVKLWPVDVSKLKHELYGSLGLARPEGCEYPAGWVHLSESVADPEFCKQLTAEQTVSRFVKGYRKTEWQKIRDRNEALDCAVYARAAANQAGWDRMTERQIASIESSLSIKAARSAEVAPVQAQEQEAPTPAPPPVVRQQPERRQKFVRSSWVNR